MDPSLLMAVLAQGHDEARQLKAQLQGPPADADSCRTLARQVRSSFETAIAVAKHLGSGGGGTSNVGSDSGKSQIPMRENSDGGLLHQEPRDTMSEERHATKGMPKWSNQVRVSLEGGIEGPPVDGHSWRKYGQKDILGANYPRGYYRCAHKSQGCLATKQVQRSDIDPTTFHVSYRGAHTCVDKRHNAQASPKRAKYSHPASLHRPQLHQDHQQLLMSLRANLKVETQGLEANAGHEAYAASSSSFSFPSTPAGCIQTQSSMLVSPSAQHNQFAGPFSPEFMAAPSWPNVQPSEPDFTAIISAATSATNSPTVDMDFSLFNPSFPFDDTTFF